MNRYGNMSLKYWFIEDNYITNGFSKFVVSKNVPTKLPKRQFNNYNEWIVYLWEKIDG